MRIFVAGATGALGRALIPRLVRAGHEVVGLSRSVKTRELLQSLGAAHAVGDLLEPEDLASAVGAWKPDIVIHAAKAIPKRGPVYFRDMRATNQLHGQGTRNLLDAAVAAGTSRILVESIVFAYGYGDFGEELITEEHPTKSQLPRRRLHELVDGVLAMENAVLEADRSGRIESTVLRCGLFYGPLAGTDRMAHMLRRRALPLPGGGRGRWPVVYVDDVADAFALAATRNDVRGIFNVVDDEPVALRDFLGEMARLADAPRAWSLPMPLGKLFAPYFTEVATTSMTVSNEHAKSVLGWRPTHPTYRDGVAAWAAASVL